MKLKVFSNLPLRVCVIVMGIQDEMVSILLSGKGSKNEANSVERNSKV